MKKNKLLIYAVCAFVTVVAAVMAVIIFKDQIAEFFADIKDKVDFKRFRHNGEFADYADM
ncbi:MAG: hypothetical protein LBH28_00780 [Oscillospiraceae bacterium]|nr:hypothetical protein [Oscillospiraceae bacterium]